MTPITGATFAVPGELATPTEGYGYARRLLADAGGAGLALTHLALPGGFPQPSAGALAETERLLMALPAGWPILIDGLALGAMPAQMLRTLPGPVVALCHHPLALETGVGAGEARRLRASETAALAACAAVIATSATTARTLVAEFGVPEERLTVAVPGTDPASRAVGSGGPGVVLLSVGSLTLRKGHDVLIAAFAGLRDLDWRLTIAGPAELDPDHAAALMAQVAATGLGERTAFAGALDAPALDRAYERADLFVLASRYEGFGMAYREAMAHGLPVLGCKGGAVAEATGGAAELVPPDDVAALRAALARLIGDTAARARLAEGCWQAAQGFVRSSDTAATVAAVLRRVAA